MQRVSCSTLFILAIITSPANAGDDRIEFRFDLPDSESEASTNDDPFVSPQPIREEWLEGGVEQVAVPRALTEAKTILEQRYDKWGVLLNPPKVGRCGDAVSDKVRKQIEEDRIALYQDSWPRTQHILGVGKFLHDGQDDPQIFCFGGIALQR